MPKLWFLLGVAVGFHAHGQSHCILKEESDSVRVYSCPPMHSRIGAIRAEFTIDIPASKLIGILLDVDHYRDWQSNTIESRILERKGRNELIYYAEIAAPWTVNNRDMIASIKVTQDSASKVVTMHSHILERDVPPKNHVVRIPLSDAWWTITPMGNSRCKINYLIDIDPGGSIPSWMVNLVSAQAPLESFTTLKRIAHSATFAKVKAEFIVD